MDKLIDTHQSKKHYLWYSIAIIGISLLFIFVFGEILVRILVPKEFYLPINNIYRSVTTGNKFTLRPNLNVTAFGVPLKTNSLGFRGPEWPLRHTDDTARIALLGDSHAFGYGVLFEDTVGEKLAELLNEKKTGRKYEVLNFGIVGYNSQQELAVLRSEVLKFNPDILIILPCSNDHKESFSVDENGFLRNAKNNDVNDESIDKLKVKTSSWLTQKSKMVFYLLFLKKQYELTSENEEISVLHEDSSVGRSSWWMGPFIPVPIPDQLMENVYHPLEEMITEAKKRSMPVIIANFNALPVYRQLFAQLSQEENVPSIELLTLFPEANSWEELLQKFGLGWNNHLNAKAHERWAQAILPIILQIQK